MEPLFDLNSNNDIENFDYIFSNIDQFDSVSNLFDFNKLGNNSNFETSAYNNSNFLVVNKADSSIESLFELDQNNIFIDSSASSSPLDSQSLDSNSNPSSNSNFNLLDASFGKNQIEPIKFTLPETENDGMKITSEIILNFEHMDEAQLLEQIEKIGDNENLCVVTSGSDDTKIDLSNSGSMSDDDGDSDEDSSLVGKVISKLHLC